MTKFGVEPIREQEMTTMLLIYVEDDHCQSYVPSAILPGIRINQDLKNFGMQIRMDKSNWNNKSSPDKENRWIAKLYY